MTVRRVGVELLELSFSPSIRDMASNVASAGLWLRDAFLAAARDYDFDPTGAKLAALSEPPFSVTDWTRERANGQPSLAGMPWVREAAMAIYAYEHGLEVEPDRKSLTKAHRRSADARARYLVSTGRTRQKGRPVEVDIPLLLFLIFSIEALIGRRFPQSRPNDELKVGRRGQRPPGGPAFRLLLAAYSLASVRQHVMPASAETVYKVAMIARTENLKQQLRSVCSSPWVGYADPELAPAEIVVEHPRQCEFLFAEAVAARRRART